MFLSQRHNAIPNTVGFKGVVFRKDFSLLCFNTPKINKQREHMFFQPGHYLLTYIMIVTYLAGFHGYLSTKKEW